MNPGHSVALRIDTGIIRDVDAGEATAGTRYLGERADAKARVERLFARGHGPDREAPAVVDAVEGSRPVAPVGAEAWLGWGLACLLPSGWTAA